MHEPTYQELSVRTPPGSSWGVFGAEDEAGTVNRLEPAHVVDAARLVRDGRVFPLDWDLGLPDPPLFGRQSMTHTVIQADNGGNDDRYDGFYPQASSQWDALSHIAHPEHGFYNGRRKVGEASDNLGIQVWAERGIAGRFVLLDAARYRAEQGIPIDPGASVPFDAADLEAVREQHGVDLRRGDILLIRFGWTEWYENLSMPQRRRLAIDTESHGSPGLARTEAILEWLWDNGISAVAADVPALEALPFDNLHLEGFLHFRLIALLGMAVGEMFCLDRLAEYCHENGRCTGLFTSAPLHKRGGIGSPPNALALV
ncbi:cyclase family protein [Amycolatopsis benzoatilytica]|uniref:cyclase family protein n=1 Tax=Amycolatopsis benzoatilytica TaxID=346045 RepID=UPI000372F913|nr:cyclase family protein [Amycolatopsis benzoatilytica]